MNKITIYEVHKRMKSLAKKDQFNEDTTILENNASLCIEKRDPKMILQSLSIGNRDTNRMISFNTSIALFDALYECGTTGQLRKGANVIIEEAVPKTRNAKDTNTNLKRKLGRLKGKVTTRVSNNIDDAKNAVNKAISSTKKNFQTNKAQIKNNVKSGLGIKDKEKKSSPKDEAYIELYENIIESLDKYIECDRIIENYESLSKRFNLERVMIENTRVNGVKDSTNKICSYVESYDMPDAIKYNTVLETMWYGLQQYGIGFTRNEIVEAATNYFCMNENGYDTCMDILKNSSIFNPEDLPSDMQIITELDPEDSNYNQFQSIDSISQEIRENYNQFNSVLCARKSVDGLIKANEGFDFNKIFAEYKKNKEPNKENKLMQLTRKLYTKSVDNIVEGTPAYLNWIRLVFVLGSFSLGPVVGCIVAIGDIFASLHFQRDETEKMQRCFENEIKISEKKLESTKDAEEKRRLEKYIEALEKAKDKIDIYYEDMLSEKELDAKYNSDDNEESDEDSFGDIKDEMMNDDDDEWDFEEAASLISSISSASDAVDNIDNYFNTIGTDSITHMDIFNADDLDSLAKLSVEYPEVWSPDLMEYVMESNVAKIRNKTITFNNSIDKYATLSAYDNAIKIIRENKPYRPKGLSSLLCLSECLDAINLIIYTNEYKSVMIEASFLNSMKLASEKIKKGIQKLSDKEKTVSRNVDVSMGNVTRAAERAFTNNNREAVIKGSLIPSASKVIKLAITTGFLWLIEPAIAVIGVLGYIGISKGQQMKEKQIILDEIDTELKMCDEYIDIAKSNNDMKALKQLYQIRKKLQREEQRIRYNMKVSYNKEVPNTVD